MTAVLALLGAAPETLSPARAKSLPASHDGPLDDQGFAAILGSVLPSAQMTPDRPMEQENLKPRARLGIWPTQPARFSPPQRGDATTSSAPAGPDDGPSGQPQLMRNQPMLNEVSGPLSLRGARPTPQPGMPELGPAFDPLTPSASNVPEGFGLEAPVEVDPLRHGAFATPFRRRSQVKPASTPQFDLAAAETARAPDALEPLEAADGATMEGDALVDDTLFERWEDVHLEHLENGTVRVEVDPDLAVEVQARRGEVDVRLEGTWDALEELGDVELDLEQAFADGGEHALSSFAQFERRRDPKPQGSANQADLKDTPAVEQRRTSNRGRLFNGVA
ncbi:MAG: hypothetical protein AAGA48_06405 [Myxococcota bacterium]